MKKSIILLSLIVLLFSCNQPPADVRMILKASGSNRPELEKVIEHYRSAGDKEKLKAAYFLIGNMDDKYALDGEAVRKYKPVFDFFGSIVKQDVLISQASTYVRSGWDSLIRILGPFRIQDAVVMPDYLNITAKYLINNIDLAFSIRDSLKWGNDIDPEKFCEYIVSYRFRHEPLESWRTYFHGRYWSVFNSFQPDSCHQLARVLHRRSPRLQGSNLFVEYPFDFLIDEMETAQYGSCVQIAAYKAMLMRSFGIPAAIDFTPLWGNHGATHTWNTLFMENGRPLHYEGTKWDLGQQMVYKAAKVYRKTFGRQKTAYRRYEDEIPERIRNDHFIDVTSEYNQTSDIEIPLKYRPVKRKSFAIICSHNNKTWIPQDYGKIRRGRALFKNMGQGNLFLAMYYEKGRLFPASDPFVLEENAQVRFISPSADKRQQMLLKRKFPLRKSIQTYHESMLGGSFQGANRPDFKDSVILYTVSTCPEKIETVIITHPSKYRYVRFSSPYRGKGDVAEIEFYGGNDSKDTIKLSGKPIGYPEVPPSWGTPYENAFDGNIDTYFNGSWPLQFCWAGLDLKRTKRITKIRYCPRSDTNFILIGDTYELCYWDEDEWISMGQKVANKASMEYENVPAGALYILHNLSRGKEERIFTYEDRMQVFW